MPPQAKSSGEFRVCCLASPPWMSAAYVINYTDHGKKLRSVDLRTGRVLWSAEEEDLGTDDAPPLVAGGRIYVTDKYGKLRVYETATGKPVWQFVFTPTKGQCPTAMALADGVLYFGGSEELMERSNGPFLWAVNAATGKELWRFKTAPGRDRGDCVSSPAVAQGTVVVTSDHTLYALDARTGAVRWKTDRALTMNGQPKTERLSEPIIVGGVIYCYMDDGHRGMGPQHGTTDLPIPSAFRRGQCEAPDGGDEWRFVFPVQSSGQPGTNGTVSSALRSRSPNQTDPVDPSGQPVYVALRGRPTMGNNLLPSR